MHTTDPTTQRARKVHRCWWCAERIEVGSTYVKWTTLDGTSFRDTYAWLTVKCHPECDAAWGTLNSIDAEEVNFGDYARGCTCEHGRCECGQIVIERDWWCAKCIITEIKGLRRQLAAVTVERDDAVKACRAAGGERTHFCPECSQLPDLAERRRNQLAAQAAEGEGT